MVVFFILYTSVLISKVICAVPFNIVNNTPVAQFDRAFRFWAGRFQPRAIGEFLTGSPSQTKVAILFPFSKR